MLKIERIESQVIVCEQSNQRNKNIVKECPRLLLILESNYPYDYP